LAEYLVHFLDIFQSSAWESAKQDYQTPSFAYVAKATAPDFVPPSWQAAGRGLRGMWCKDL